MQAGQTIPAQDITGLVLAGGRGSRMGGADKGLETFHGVPLALHTLRRLHPQVGALMLSANRNIAVYESFGAPVWPDSTELGDYAGPLAGFITGLQHCSTPWLLTVPCDTPLLPADLAARMAQACQAEGAEMAVASAAETDTEGLVQLRPQPVFCLMHKRVLASLLAFTGDGGRKIGAWAAQHKTVQVPFNLQGDDAQAFFNANTLAELQQLQSRLP
ncbi:MAG: molybdenum cofactor guanylyltransferase MobA [Pseudomonadota bacterium]